MLVVWQDIIVISQLTWKSSINDCMSTVINIMMQFIFNKLFIAFKLLRWTHPHVAPGTPLPQMFLQPALEAIRPRSHVLVAVWTAYAKGNGPSFTIGIRVQQKQAYIVVVPCMVKNPILIATGGIDVQDDVWHLLYEALLKVESILTSIVYRSAPIYILLTPILNCLNLLLCSLACCNL